MQTRQLPGNRKEKGNILMDSKRRLWGEKEQKDDVVKVVLEF